MIAAAPLAVIAIGNPSRGDDALGPLLMERLGAWLEIQGKADAVDLIEDFQLQVEHAMDLQDRRLVVFVDAGTGTPAPFSFTALEASSDFGHTTHAISPGAVLHVFQETMGGRPPPCFVLCIRGESFELGAELTDPAKAHLEAALQQLQHLLAHPDLSAWQMAITSAATASQPIQ